jgi:hypothetical protein
MEIQPNSDPFKELITASLLETPPDGLTASIMQKIPAGKPLVLKPIINGKGWLLVALISCALAMIGFKPSQGTLPESYSNTLNLLTGYLSLDWLASPIFTSLILPASLALLLLTFVDAKFRTARNAGIDTI